ncbi:hypothetical protein H5410_052758, partial [Solanum commersonii]
KNSLFLIHISFLYCALAATLLQITILSQHSTKNGVCSSSPKTEKAQQFAQIYFHLL